MTGVAKHTVLKLLVELGAACSAFLNETMQNLSCSRIQVDEIWQFVGCKQKNVTVKRIDQDGICGDVWTWTAIDADTKVIPCWMLGCAIRSRLATLWKISQAVLLIVCSSRQTA
jgi:hypothetical protein